MRRAAFSVILAFLAFGAGTLQAQNTLVFLELQGVAAFSSAEDRFQFFSLMPHHSMQKPSVGFDLIRRFSGKKGDFGVLALQTRLAYDHDGDRPFELQIYNAYFRLKAGFADVWAGHNRPALGISYALDNHALLLPSPAMTGFGFDRDWGLGVHRDFSWGDAAASLTAGSGMPLRLRGNYLASLRASRGVLARDNYSLGISLAFGRTLETMGDMPMEADPVAFAAVAADATYLWRNLENRFEALAGRKDGQTIASLFWRGGLNLLEEGRLKVEAQPSVLRAGGAWDYVLAGGLSYLATADLTARLMVYYDHGRHDTRYVVQLYFYKSL